MQLILFNPFATESGIFNGFTKAQMAFIMIAVLQLEGAPAVCSWILCRNRGKQSSTLPLIIKMCAVL